MKYFFAGILGTGMSSLAEVLSDLGNEVIGCDDAKSYSFTIEELKKRNIKVYKDADKLTKDMIFVYTAAIHEEHYAIKKAKELGCTMYGYYEMIGEITKKYNSICIAGTHGKTTTTALLAHIFENTIGTNYIIGDGTGRVNKNSNNFIVESCEFERHFLHYRPKYSVITNIDLDHIDCYKNIEEYTSVFEQFASLTKEKVIACGDDPNVLKLKSDKIIYYGFNDNNDVIAKNLNLTSTSSSFDVYIDKKYYGHFNLNIFGKHMVLNALACIYICYLYNISLQDTIYYMNDFKGAKRRFSEEKINDVILVDDYAHHPTEVETVLLTAKQKYPDKEIVAVLIPYTVSRFQAFYKDFAKVLKLADKAYITDIEPAREKFSDYEGVSTDLILNLDKSFEHISKEEISKLYKHKNAVIAFMGCKDPTWLIEAYKEGLNK